ncbi:ionotropic glutamate receptor [Aureococcus anophagefferens]|nr:ionotropic glutamate receptor [Aureococcus anophagefferens]
MNYSNWKSTGRQAPVMESACDRVSVGLRIRPLNSIVLCAALVVSAADAPPSSRPSSPPTTMAVDAGDAACPCLPLSEAPGNPLASTNLTNLNLTSCSLLAPSSAGVPCLTQAMVDAGACQCYADSYGYGECAAHDEGLAPSCDDVGAEAAWCGLRWCYVDEALCHGSAYADVASGERSATTSAMTTDALNAKVPGLGAAVAAARAARRFFSYGTCGEDESAWDEWTTAENIAGLRGVTVYLGAIAGDYYPSTYEANGTGSPFEGAFIDYVTFLLESGGATVVNAIDVSAASAAAVGSFSGLSLDVKHGVYDVGVGPIYPTAERLELAAFTRPMIHAFIYLYAPQPTKDELNSYDVALRLFTPFKASLWVAILLVAVCVGMIQTLDLGHMDDAAFARHMKWHKETSFTESAAAFAYAALRGAHAASVDLFSAGVAETTSDSVATRFLIFGWAFFILIITASYTANLAAFLTSERGLVWEFGENAEEVLYGPGKVCAWPSTMSPMRDVYPRAEFVAANSYGEFRSHLEDGTCDIIATDEYDAEHTMEMNAILCDFDLVALDTVVVMAYAWPAADDPLTVRNMIIPLAVCFACCVACVVNAVKEVKSRELAAIANLDGGSFDAIRRWSTGHDPGKVHDAHGGGAAARDASESESESESESDDGAEDDSYARALGLPETASYAGLFSDGPVPPPPPYRRPSLASRSVSFSSAPAAAPPPPEARAIDDDPPAKRRGRRKRGARRASRRVEREERLDADLIPDGRDRGDTVDLPHCAPGSAGCTLQ